MDQGLLTLKELSTARRMDPWTFLTTQFDTLVLVTEDVDQEERAENDFLQELHPLSSDPKTRTSWIDDLQRDHGKPK